MYAYMHWNRKMPNIKKQRISKFNPFHQQPQFLLQSLVFVFLSEAVFDVNTLQQGIPKLALNFSTFLLLPFCPTSHPLMTSDRFKCRPSVKLSLTCNCDRRGCTLNRADRGRNPGDRGRPPPRTGRLVTEQEKICPQQIKTLCVEAH